MYQNETVQPKNEPKLYKKTQAAIAMMDSGMDARTALQVVNNTEKPAKATIYSLKDKYRKYSLTHPRLVKAANSQIKRILSGEVRELQQQKLTKSGQVVEVIEKIAPSDTNIIAAATMVYDRLEPITKQNQGDTVNNTLIISPELSGLIGMMRSGKVERAADVIEIRPDNQGQIASSTGQDSSSTNNIK